MTNTIWCEKYRPKSVSELVGNENIVDALLTYAERNELPNMLMAGSSGCGKTSAVQSLANDCVLPDGEYLEINTSDERGIETVRNRLKLFSGKRVSDNSMRLIFLDEADGMTSHAQLALKALMDMYSSKVTFVLSCNDIACIHESIISRCVTFRFQKISTSTICKKLEELASKEALQISMDKLSVIADEANGDLRTAVNALQMVSALSVESKLEKTTSSQSEKVVQLLQSYMDRADGKEIAYRKKVVECLQARGRCENYYGIDSILQGLESHGILLSMSTTHIRTMTQIMFGKTTDDNTEPISSVLKLITVLRFV